MLFWLKKVVSFWLMPLPVCLVLLVAGLWLTRSARRARLGRVLLILATTLLILTTNKTVSKALIAPLEQRYAAIPELHEGEPLPPALAACRFVVVLGAGHTDTPGLAATLQLSEAGLARITEGSRLLRALPDAKLVVSGPPVGANPSHATVLARAAESLGVARGRVVFVDTARDTEDEANAVKKLVGDAPVALVTSAWHMPRAVGLFRHAGVTALPCPAGFLGNRNRDFRLDDLTWDSESLFRSNWAWHEYLGLLWNLFRGRA
jgi:uncharacterized SAM-binding protein YcdF (DUF218 family)